jgi:hypothetical protein
MAMQHQLLAYPYATLAASLIWAGQHVGVAESDEFLQGKLFFNNLHILLQPY